MDFFHFKCHLATRNTIKGAGEKKEQTNNMLGLTQVQKGSFITLCICRLTLAWISSETSTKLLGIPTYPDWSSSLLWTSSHPTGLSAVPCRLPSCITFCQLLLRVPLSNPLLAFPYPLPVTPRSRVQNPLSGFAPKPDKGIVCLADHLHSVTPLKNNDHL